jgi:hypothetical protein
VRTRRIETASTAPREESGFGRSEMPSSDSLLAICLQQLPVQVFRHERVDHHALAARSAFRHSNGKRNNEIRILQPMKDARARPTELEILSRAGAVARFALRRLAPPGESRPSTSPTGTCLGARSSLYALSRFETALTLAFASSPQPHLPGYGCAGDEPRWRCVRRRSPPLLHDVPSYDDPPRHHGERREPRPARSCL